MIGHPIGCSFYLEKIRVQGGHYGGDGKHGSVEKPSPTGYK